ncbi:MAG: hypothetical protein GC208_04970 [Alphaproteobacteria bacterium]|nr:hypothetical protein [Alphaproteobacteria bacterium]
MPLSALTLFIVSALQAADAIEAPQEITALYDCSRLEVPASCFSISLFSAFADDRGNTRWSRRVLELQENGWNPALVTIPVEGRLNGGDAAVHFVTFGRWEGPCTDDAQILLRGVSEDGHPVIATEQGEFEITEPGIYPGMERAVLIDPETRSVIRRYYGDVYWHTPLFYHSPDDVTAYLPREERCITAPTEGQTVMDAAGRCDVETRPWPEPSERGLTASTEADREIAREALTGTWWIDQKYWGEETTYRMQNHDIIVVEDQTVCT